MQNFDSDNFQQEIPLSNDLSIDDRLRIKQEFEKLYLSPQPLTYQVTLTARQLPFVNSIFDEIIRSHGVLEVEFLYLLKESDADDDSLVITSA